MSTETSPTPLGYRPGDVQSMLGVGKTKVAEMIRRGELESVKIGRTRIVTARSIEKLLYGKAA